MLDHYILLPADRVLVPVLDYTGVSSGRGRKLVLGVKVGVGDDDLLVVHLGRDDPVLGPD